MNKKAINFDLDTKKLREFHPKGITQGSTDDKTKYYLLDLKTLVIYILYPIYKIVNPFF